MQLIAAVHLRVLGIVRRPPRNSGDCHRVSEQQGPLLPLSSEKTMLETYLVLVAVW